MCEVGEIDWRGETHGARLDALVSLDARMARLHAEQVRVLAALAADPPTVSLPGGDDRNWVVEDVSCALRLSPGLARARLAEAHELARLPEAVRSLGEGAITMAHARVLADATMGLDDATAVAVQQRVMGRAAEQSVGAFRQSVRRAVLAVDTRTIEARRAANVAERRVFIRPAGEGTSELWALLPHEGAAAVMAAITGLADRRGATDDERTADQRRADALVQLGLDALAGQVTEVLPRQQRFRPAVHVTVALSTLIGLDDEPAELDGVGAIPAGLARQLAADPSGTWRRLVTDPLGRLVDYGRTTYRPPSALADHVIARDRTCRFPHCTRSAKRCELDHLRPWARGGTTDAANLVALCSRHHHLRHETRWTYSRGSEDGTVSWQSPRGRTYATRPVPYPLDRTSDPPAEPEVGPQ
jgi:hypothetical protein